MNTKRYFTFLLLTLTLLVGVLLITRAPVTALVGSWSRYYSTLFYLDGRVGIGTKFPRQRLEVGGDARFSRRAGTYLDIRTPSDGVKLVSNNKNIIIPLGKVGIGTHNPTRRLTVNGSIRAKEIIVDSGWADHVFSKDYKLLSLEELEKYIAENGKLPRLPSAASVGQDGIGASQSITLLVEKVEELTLYTIQQQKQISELESRIYLLEQEQ